MGIKITKFIDSCIEVYVKQIDITKCRICYRPAETIIIKYGFDSFCRKVWEVKQYCKHCEKTNKDFFIFKRINPAEIKKVNGSIRGGQQSERKRPIN